MSLVLIALGFSVQADLSDSITQDPARALVILDTLCHDNPLARPWVEFGKLQANVELGRFDSAVQILQQLDQSQKHAGLRLILSKCLEEKKHEKGLEIAKRFDSDSSASVLYLVAKMQEASGKTRQARTTWRAIARLHPKTSYGKKALDSGALSQNQKLVLRCRRGDYKKLIKQLRKQKHLSDTASAVYAVCLSKKRKHAEAAKLFVNLNKWHIEGWLRDEALFRAGVSYLNLGKPEKALDALLAMEHDPEKSAREASFVVVEADRDSVWKRRQLERIALRFKDENNPKALLWVGLLSIALDRPMPGFLKASLEKSQQIGLSARCYYWLYRSTGDGLWKARLLSVDPISFYAMRLRPWIPVDSTPIRQWAGLKHDPKDAIGALMLIARLDLIETSRDWVLNTPEVQPEAASAAIAAGDFLTGSRILTSLYRSARKRDTLPVELVKSMYPFYYWDEVRWAADTNKIEPELLLAVAREESRFNPQAVSWAGAKGIVQLMDFTARRIRKKTGYKYRIFDPKDNLFLGAYHLRERLDDFGKIHLAVAAYNAGPKAVKRWLGFAGDWPDDLFCEFITYTQTRRYTRHVMRSYMIYKWLNRQGPDSN